MLGGGDIPEARPIPAASAHPQSEPSAVQLLTVTSCTVIMRQQKQHPLSGIGAATRNRHPAAAAQQGERAAHRCNTQTPQTNTFKVMQHSRSMFKAVRGALGPVLWRAEACRCHAWGRDGAP